MRLCIRMLSQRVRKALPLMWLLVGVTLGVFCSDQVFAVPQGDDFNNNVKDTTKWGTDQVRDRGALSETRGRLEYVSAGSSTDSSDRPWILRQFPSNANWSIQIDAANTTSPISNYDIQKYAFTSFGINVRHIRGASNEETGNEIEVELAAYGNTAGLPPFMGFLAEFSGNGGYWTDAQQSTVLTSAPIRLSFDSLTKIFSVAFFADPGTGSPQWIDFGTFGVGPSGGGYNGNVDWSLTDDGKFVAYVFGYSNYTSVKDGQLYGDNLLEDGGTPWVGPLPGPSAGPTGRFRFAFPAGNLLLARILSLTGNYSGLFFTLRPRNYAMDVAQDESGKLSIMGTMDGAKNKDGGSEISGAGTITTVNGKPSGKLKGSFAGTFDDLPTTASITASGPVDVTDIGGKDGFIGTYSSKGKFGGVPFKGSRETFEAPEGTSDNLKKDWTLQLDIASRQDSKGKSYLVASAQLVLPNGDTIVFPEKKTKYSAKTGYSLSFTRGTNTTAEPDKLDTKTSISIKGMTLEKQDAVWQPTGGTITYKFLGQKGTGNLVDFISTAP